MNKNSKVSQAEFQETMQELISSVSVYRNHMSELRGGLVHILSLLDSLRPIEAEIDARLRSMRLTGNSDYKIAIQQAAAELLKKVDSVPKRVTNLSAFVGEQTPKYIEALRTALDKNLTPEKK